MTRRKSNSNNSTKQEQSSNMNTSSQMDCTSSEPPITTTSSTEFTYVLTSQLNESETFVSSYARIGCLQVPIPFKYDVSSSSSTCIFEYVQIQIPLDYTTISLQLKYNSHVHNVDISQGTLPTAIYKINSSLASKELFVQYSITQMNESTLKADPSEESSISTNTTTNPPMESPIHTSTSSTLTLTFYLQLSTELFPVYYSIDILSWCFDEKNIPEWMYYYVWNKPINTTANTANTIQEDKNIALQLLNNIAENRSDLNYSTSEIENIDKTLHQLGLITQLRTYQLQGVLWLLQHLNFTLPFTSSSCDKYGYLNGWVPLYSPLTSNCVWYSLITGELLSNLPIISIESSVKGSLLGDYMGLGKSIQILCVILLHKHSYTYSNNIINITSNSNDINICTSVVESSTIDTTIADTSEYPSTNKRHKANSTILVDPCTCGYRQLPHCSSVISCVLCTKLRHTCCIYTSSADSSPNLEKNSFPNVEKNSFPNIEKNCFTCVCRTLELTPLHSKATLLILPSSLISQWTSEIQKHMHSTLSVFIYTGVKQIMDSIKSNPLAARQIDPRCIASYDIIITSLNILKTEMYYTTLNNTNTTTMNNHTNIHINKHRRSHQIYDKLISPLLCIHFSLLIIDETQQIESESSASKMAMKIHSSHRIVLSGTPIAKYAINDLFYLFKFLRVPYFSDFSIWTSLISNPFHIHTSIALSRLVELFGLLCLRRRLEDVNNQLCATTQLIDIQYLILSSFEQMEYDTYAQPIQFALQNKSNNTDNMSNNTDSSSLMAEDSSGIIKHNNVKSKNVDMLLLHQVEVLRKGCCHPHAFTNRNIFNNNVNNIINNHININNNSFEYVMISHAERLALSIEDEQRKLLFSLTGLAGCCMLRYTVLCNQFNNNSIDHNNIVNKSLYFLQLAIQVYYYSLISFENSRQIKDIFAMGIISSDDCQLQINSKYIRADNIVLYWCLSDYNLYSTLQNSNINVNCDGILISDFTIIHSLSDPIPEYTLCDMEHISDTIDASRINDGNNVFTAKIDFNHGKRIYEVVAYHDLTSLDLTSISQDSVTIYVFACEIIIGGGSTTLKCMNIQLPIPFGMNRIVNEEKIHSTISNGIRSKQVSIRINSFHSSCLLLTRNSSDEICALIIPFEQLGKSLPGKSSVEVNCRISLTLRGAEYDVDSFQELHIRENLAKSLQLFTQESGSMSCTVVDSLEGLNIPVLFNNSYGNNASNEDAIEIIVPNSNNQIATSSTDTDTENVSNVRAINSPSTSSIECTEVASSQQSILQTIKDEYVQRARNRRMNVMMDLHKSIYKYNESFSKLEQLFPAKDITWYSAFITPLLSHTSIYTEYTKLHTALMTDIKANITRNGLAYINIKDIQLSNLTTFITNKYTTLLSIRHAILAEFEELSPNPSELQIRETSNCSKCCESFGKIGPICAHCTLELKIYEYSGFLTAYKRKVMRLKQIREDKDIFNNHDDDLFVIEENNEYEVDGEVIMLLRELRKFVSSSLHQSLLIRFDHESLICIRQGAKLHEEQLGILQSELVILRLLWSTHQTLLFTYDDLEQAVTTLQLSVNDYNEVRLGYLMESEISNQACNYYAQAKDSIYSIQTKTSKMRFIRYEESWRRTSNDIINTNNDVNNSNNNNNSSENGENDRECVICQANSIEDMRMLPCFHCFHYECIRKWLDTRKQCPLCQTHVTVKDLSLVLHTPQISSSSSMGVLRRGTSPIERIRGDFGTKINVIVGDIVRLVRDTEEKAIVFSQWIEVHTHICIYILLLLNGFSFFIYMRIFIHCCYKNTDYCMYTHYIIPLK